MAETTIEWTDFTFNPWSGCSKVSAGCANCYAEVNYSVKVRGVKWGPQGNRIVKAESGWKEPLKWNRDAAEQFAIYEEHKHQGGPAYQRPRVFCASLADVFEDWQGPIKNAAGFDLWHLYPPSETWMSNPGDTADKRLLTMADVRARLFRLIDATPHLGWLLLTKRPENIERMMLGAWLTKYGYQVDGCTPRTDWVNRWAIPKNVWLGVSVESQQTADERIPHLLKVPAAVRFLSVEPMLGPVDLEAFLGRWECQSCGTCVNGRSVERATSATDICKGYCHDDAGCVGRSCPGCGKKHWWSVSDSSKLHWVICGGESGKNARPFNLDWARSLRDQCKAAGVPFFMKQAGSNVVCRMVPIQVDVADWKDFPELMRNSPKCDDPEEWPEDLRVREIPKGMH